MARFGDLLEELRKSRGLSQLKLAEELGWKQSKISYLEALEEVPKEDDLLVICAFFNVRPEYFYNRREDRTPQAIEYLQQLRNSVPEASPKAAIAFYSKLDRFPKEEQEQAVRLTKERTRRIRKPKTK